MPGSGKSLQNCVEDVLVGEDVTMIEHHVFLKVGSILESLVADVALLDLVHVEKGDVVACAHVVEWVEGLTVATDVANGRHPVHVSMHAALRVGVHRVGKHRR